jgi:hypothetical protein
MVLMNEPTTNELIEALRAINSLLSKCEKVQVKFLPGTSQHTLLRNRINALRISSSLITKAIEESLVE